MAGRIAVEAPKELASLRSDAKELVRLCAQMTKLLKEAPKAQDQLEQAAAGAVDLLAQASATAAYLRMRVAELRRP